MYGLLKLRGTISISGLLPAGDQVEASIIELPRGQTGLTGQPYLKWGDCSSIDGMSQLIFQGCRVFNVSSIPQCISDVSSQLAMIGHGPEAAYPGIIWWSWQSVNASLAFVCQHEDADPPVPAVPVQGVAQYYVKVRFNLAPTLSISTLLAVVGASIVGSAHAISFPWILRLCGFCPFLPLPCLCAGRHALEAM